MLAFDGGVPALTSTALVIISVNRNLVDPEFVEVQERVNIPETLPPGSIITRVQAEDADLAVRTHPESKYCNVVEGYLIQHFFPTACNSDVDLLFCVYFEKQRPFLFRLPTMSLNSLYLETNAPWSISTFTQQRVTSHYCVLLEKQKMNNSG